MERFSIYAFDNLSEEKYLETWKLDNKTFEPKDKLTKKRALELFYSSNKSTIVLWDNEKDCLVGYFSPYLVNHKYASDYIISDQTYQQALQKSVFVTAGPNITADIYIFSTVIVSEYRDAKMPVDKTNLHLRY